MLLIGARCLRKLFFGTGFAKGVWNLLIFVFGSLMAKDCEGFHHISRHDEMYFVSWSSPSACDADIA